MVQVWNPLYRITETKAGGSFGCRKRFRMSDISRKTKEQNFESNNPVGTVFHVLPFPKIKLKKKAKTF